MHIVCVLLASLSDESVSCLLSLYFLDSSVWQPQEEQCPEQASFPHSEEEIQDHWGGKGGGLGWWRLQNYGNVKYISGHKAPSWWWVQSPWQQHAGGPANFQPREASLHHWKCNPETSTEVHTHACTTASLEKCLHRYALYHILFPSRETLWWDICQAKLSSSTYLIPKIMPGTKLITTNKPIRTAKGQTWYTGQVKKKQKLSPKLDEPNYHINS